MAGSFSLIHANLEAVKFPGEFNKWERHLSSPIVSNAFCPYGTARESHQIIAGRNTCWSLSTHTNPCIWYEMPIALISAALTPDSVIIACVANFKFPHQLSGSCSAHPGFTAIMSASVFGKNADDTHLPVSAFTKLAFTDELPMS